MFGKTLHLILLFLLTAPSSGLHIPKSCSSIDMQKIVIEQSPGWKDAMNIVNCAKDVFQQNEKLRNSFQRIGNQLNKLAEKGTEVVLNNPSVLLVVYVGGLMAISYYFAAESTKMLIEAENERDDLRLLTETEIYPLLKLIEQLLFISGARNLCKAEEKLLNMLDRTVLKLRTARKDIEGKILESVNGENKNTALQWMSTTSTAVSAKVILSAPCAFGAFFACPALMIGAAGLVGSVVSYLIFENNKLTHQQIMELLWNARSEALMAEKSLRLARFNTEAVCTQVMINDTNIFNLLFWLLVVPCLVIYALAMCARYFFAPVKHTRRKI